MDNKDYINELSDELSEAVLGKGEEQKEYTVEGSSSVSLSQTPPSSVTEQKNVGTNVLKIDREARERKRMDEFVHGHLAFAAKECRGLLSFRDFEKDAIRYGHAVLFTDWNWRQDHPKESRIEPYVYIEVMGVYTDLNMLGQAIRERLYSNLRMYFGENTWRDLFKKNGIRISSEYTGGDNLEVWVYRDDDSYESIFEFHLSFVNLNAMGRALGAGFEGWKFDLLTTAERDARIEERRKRDEERRKAKPSEE